MHDAKPRAHSPVTIQTETVFPDTDNLHRIHPTREDNDVIRPVYPK